MPAEAEPGKSLDFPEPDSRPDDSTGHQQGPPAFRVQLDERAADLDSLLRRAKSKRLDIVDLCLAAISGQLLEFVRRSQEQSLQSGGQDVLTAAQLIVLKSKALLPDPPAEAGGEDDSAAEGQGDGIPAGERERLRRAARILERFLSAEAGALPAGPRAADLKEEVEPDEVDATVFDLVRAFGELLERAQDDPALEFEREAVSVASRIRHVLDHLSGPVRGVTIRDLLRDGGSRRSVVATFLALLELVKAGAVALFQPERFGEIEVRRGDQFSAVRDSAEAGWMAGEGSGYIH